MKKADIMKLLHILLIVGTVIFIFSQSMKPQAVSEEESSKVGEIIEEIFPPEEPVGEFIQINLRKIAHFTEFFVLGIELAAYVLIFMRKTKIALFSYPLALIIAFFDESIQILSKRGPMISDVWVDFFGYTASTLIIFFLYSVIRLILRRVIAHREVKGNG